jgi:hypothetical protein
MTAEEQVMALVTRLRPVLAGKPPEIQGAALADLLATWLAGHVWTDDDGIDQRETARRREELLNMHIRLVRALVAIEHKRCTDRRSDMAEMEPGWPVTGRRCDGMTIDLAPEGGRFVIKDAAGKTVVDYCPCCNLPFRSTTAAQKLCNALYPLKAN